MTKDRKDYYNNYYRNKRDELTRAHALILAHHIVELAKQDDALSKIAKVLESTCRINESVLELK